jgi:hypothetical protein
MPVERDTDAILVDAPTAARLHYRPMHWFPTEAGRAALETPDA